jgi:hypothetical protein
VARRAWYVVVLGLGVTALSAFWVWNLPGVYYGRVDVIFLRPVTQIVPNGLSVNSQSVIATAGVVQREVSGGRPDSRVTSDQVTIVGQGIKEGVSVSLPNSGGQWANNFDRAVLIVQVADKTPQGAQERLRSTIAQINETLQRRQSEAEVQPDLFIRTKLSPQTPQVYYETGNSKRAVMATLLLGAALTWGALVLVESRRLAQRLGRVHRCRLPGAGESPTAAVDPESLPRLPQFQ